MITTTEYDLGSFKGKDTYGEIKKIAKGALAKSPGLWYLREDLEHELVKVYMERVYEAKEPAKEKDIGFILYQEAKAFVSKQSNSQIAVGTYKPSDIGTALRNGDGLAIKTLDRANEKDREFAERVYLADEDPATVIAELWPKEGVTNPAKRVSNKTEEVNERLSKVANWEAPPVLDRRPSASFVQASLEFQGNGSSIGDFRTNLPPKRDALVTRASRNNMALPPWERFDYPEDGYVGPLPGHAEEVLPEPEVITEVVLEPAQIAVEPSEHQEGTDMHPALVAAVEMAQDGFSLDEQFYPAFNGLSDEDRFFVLHGANPEVHEAVKRRSLGNISTAQARLIEMYDSLVLVT